MMCKYSSKQILTAHSAFQNKHDSTTPEARLSASVTSELSLRQLRNLAITLQTSGRLCANTAIIQY